VKDEHVKDTAEDVVQGVAWGVAEGVLGAAGDGGVKMLRCSLWHASSSSLGSELRREIPDFVAFTEIFLPPSHWGGLDLKRDKKAPVRAQ